MATTAIRVPRIRWFVMWMVLFVLFLFLFSWGLWKVAGNSEARELLSTAVLSVSLLSSGFIAWVVALQFKPARMTLPFGIETSAPLVASAAPRMKHTVERLETGEIVLRNVRSVLGVHPTIVVRPLSAAAIRIEGPGGHLSRLAELLTGQRRKPDWEPTLWEVGFALLLGGFLLLVALYIPFESCASLELSAAGAAAAVGSGMSRLCDHWGPFVPAAIGVLIAMLPLAYSVAAWREYRKQRQEPR